MDSEAISTAFNQAVELFLDQQFSISGLISRLGGGSGGKLHVVEALGGNRATARRNLNRWLAQERGQPKQSRKPGAANLSRLHKLFLQTVKRIRVDAPGLYTDYNGKRSSYRNIANVGPAASDKGAPGDFINRMQQADTVAAWDAILEWYGVWPGDLIPEPGQVAVTITLE
jgi:hypothetical protein